MFVVTLFQLILTLAVFFLVTFADLLGVPDGGPDHNSRDSFVGVGRGFDILISAPKMKKRVFPDSAYF